MKQKISQEQLIEFSAAIEKSKAEDFGGILVYRFWYKFYYIIYPLSKWFANKMVKPNTITLLMFPSALLAALCFMSRNIILICIGAILIHFFQIFDFCDGKVARATQQKSPLGRELDYLMHVVSHPVVFFSFYFLISINGNISSSCAVMIILTGIIVEATNRSLHNLSVAINNKNDSPYLNVVKESPIPGKASIRSAFDNFYRGVISFPFFMCIAPGIFLVEYFFRINTPIFTYFIILQVGVNFLKVLSVAINIMKRCLKS